MFGKNKSHIHPNPRPDLTEKSEEYVRSILSKEEADVYLNPIEHSEMPGYLIANNGADSTPTRVRVVHGHIIEPDGITARHEGDPMLVPKYIADVWLAEGRVERI